MSYFLVSVLQSFLPVALLLGLSWTIRQTPLVRPMVLLSLIGFFGGTFTAAHLPDSQQWALWFTCLQIALILLFLLNQFTSGSRSGYVWQFVLVLLASLRWGNA